MPTIAQAAQGIVTALWGHAVIRGADGRMRPLKLGDAVRKGDVILTTQDGIVQITPEEGGPHRATATATATSAPAAGEDDIDRVITQLNQGDSGTAPGAGLSGGEGGSLEAALRVDRIAEGVSPAEALRVGSVEQAPRLDSAGSDIGDTDEPQPTPTAPPALSASSSSIGVAEEGAPANLGLRSPTGAQAGATVTVTDVPVIGEIHKADGSLVVAGTVLAPGELAGLVYVPPADYNGSAPVGEFRYLVTSGAETASGGTTITVTAVNDAPVALAGTASGAEDAVLPVPLGGRDVDGQVTAVTVTAIPAGSTLLLADGVTAVQLGQVLGPAQAAGLLWRPAADFNGSAGIVFTVTDDAGAVSAPARVDILVTPVNDAPTVTGETANAVGSAPIVIDVLANDRDPEGGALAVGSASVDPSLGSVTVNPDGSLRFAAAPGVTGTVTVSYTVVDAAGASATGTVTITVAPEPVLTVDAPALTNDATPTITGTSNLPAGSVVTLTITDSAGAVQTIATTVVAGGTYSVDVPVALAEGSFTVVASATDAAGNVASANDVGVLDLTAPSLTVDVPALTNDTTPTITGTSNLAVGSVVTLTITDSAGAVQTITATVVAGGTYSVNVPVALAEGNFTVVASAADSAGNQATANDAGALDRTAPSLTVDAPALTNDSTPTITGTTNLPVGSTVTLTITDSAGAVQTITATVVAGGTYSVDLPTALAEGNFTVVASATDAAGNAASANDVGALDLTAPSLTVDAPALTNDSTPTITGTTNLSAGSIVTLTITDSAGAVQTITATVVAGGTYSVDVPAALAEGNFTVVASAADAAGNQATANDVGAIDLTAPSLTVDAPALTNDATPTITGTTNLPAGSVVTLTITDSAGAVQTIIATVVAGGTYSVDVPAALAEGNFTVVASAADAAGNAASANDVGALDLTAPSLTVDAPALTNDATPTITGTTNLPAGSVVTLTVTDSAGAVQTITATVVAGGTYSVDVTAALAEGSFTVVVSAADAAGNSASANDVGALDLTAPSLTVDAPALTNDSTPTINGTTNLPAGSVVTLTVTDSAGAVQTVTATVVAAGTYSVDVPAALAEGNFTVVASAADAAGNQATANDAGALDITAPSLTVDAPALTNDSTPTITGTTNLPAGSVVTLTVTDTAGAVQTVTATVVAGGTYSVDVPAALAEGNFTVVASASDAAGNPATANDAGELDLTAPSLTVDAPALTNDSTPTITGTTNLPVGATVTLTVTDSAGAVQTIIATVAVGGTYSVDVPAAMAEGNFTVVASATDAAGNNASANDAGALDLTAPSLTVDAPALTNDSTPTITGTTNLPAGSTVTLTVTDSAGAVQTVTATVAAGGTYSVDVPAALAEGSFTVVASATDAAGNVASANDVGALDLTAPSLTVDVPTLTNDSTPTITGTTNLPAGSVVTLTITDSAGALQIITATVVAGGTYSVEVPAALAEGNFTVVASAADSAGNQATANDAGALDRTAPSLTVDAPALTNDSTPTITGTTNLPVGSTVTLTVTDSAGVVQTVTATVVAGGTYSVDVPAALAEGNFTVVASATDAAGNNASANDVGALDLTAPSLTVDAPALTNDATPTITGTTNLPAGSVVTLTVTDSAGAVQTITATVAAGGTYSVDVPAALAEGSFTVVASAADAAGNAVSANDVGALDLTAPSLTVDAPALTNDSTPTITGTTNLPAGSTVTLTITDSAGAVQTITATVVAGGTYSVDVPTALTEGNFTVVASAADVAGNTASANDAGALDLTAPSLTVDAPALTNDSTPTITGTTNLPVGATVTLTVTDSAGAVQTITATVVAGGTYSVDVPAALAEGNFTVVASATDAAGNAASANDAGALDITAPSLTVDAPALTNDSTPTLTGTTNLPAGSTVTLTVADSAGAVQTITATVVAGGAYSVDVPAALAEGNFTVVASATDAAGNAASANDAGALDITAPSLTVDAPALTNDSTPTISGTTNLPAGSVVTLTVTDSAGAVQTVSATVVAGGTYSVDVPSALAEGAFTVVASAADAAGNQATANDAGSLDLTAPSLTVDAPALTNDSTPTITGTTNLPAGSVVTLTITDSAGAVQTITATVVAGGTYSVDVPTALAEGAFAVVATAADAAGNQATTNDAGALDLTAPSLTVEVPALTNDTTPTITGTSNLPVGSVVTLTITDSAGAVQTITATVVAGGTYSVDVPAALAEGSFTVVASAADAAGNAASANDAGALDLTAPSLTVDAPALTNDSTPTITGTTNLPAGSIVTLTVTDSVGAVQTVTPTVLAGGTYSVDVPAALAEGNFTVVATAADAAGNQATASDAGALDLTAPSLTVDAPALTNDSTPTITGTTNLPVGATVTLTVTDSAGAVQTVTATVVAGGTYSVDVPAALAEGSFTVVASAADAAGNSASANDVGALDLTAPSLTVDAPALTNDSTPTITGTTNLPAGSVVTLTVTDSAGTVQIITATVVAGGAYSVDVPAALAEGNFTVVASAADAAGNQATANDAGSLDFTAPSLTVDAPALTNDSTPTITGTTNLPVGSTVTLTVTDSAGAVQAITATVVAGGTYSVDVPAALAEGNFTVVASATDAAGNAASANDAGALDLTAPSLTVDAPALTNDSTPTITGTTNLPAGSIVTLTVTDSAGAVQTVTATVVAGGTYSVDVPAALAEGIFTVVASSADAAGNAASANDVGALDLTAPSLTVDAPALTNDSTPTITGTTNLPAGSVVTLTVTDSAGAAQTITATVVAGGTYSVDVPAALAEGSFTVVASAADAAGNSASANDVGALDLTAPSLTVDAPALTNDPTPTITGTTNLPAGSVVTLTVTDSAGAVQTITAAVVAGGTYSVDVPAALAEGSFTVVASAADAAGNAASANDAGALDLTAPSLTVGAPALTNDSTPTITGTTNLPAGSIVTLTVTDSAGAVQTITATVVAGGTYSVDVAAALAEGNFTVVASAADAAGNTASANDVGALDLTAPLLTVDAPALTNDSTPTITGTTSLPAGSTVTLTVTDSAGAVQTITAAVVAGGTYTVDVPAALAEGNFTVVASASDAAGNAASASDVGALDLTAPSLTVDAPALTNDTTPTVTGTTNLPVGSVVSLTVTDSAGAVQTITATVVAGGTYSVDVPAALAEGNFTVVASAADAAGNQATANDVGAIDLTAPSLTVDAPALTNDSTPTITGTTNLPVGATVTLTVTDSAGAVQTITATVVAGGTYSVDAPAALAEGNFTVVASAADAAGNQAAANDVGAIDLTAPSLTIDAPALTNDSTPTITGTTNLPAGSVVTLTVTDSAGAVQTITVTVVAGGTYSVDVPAALAEGNFTVVASAADAAGNQATANDSGALDLTAPSLTVDAPALTNDSTPTITGTTNLPAGSVVTLTVTDSAGAVQTFTATVAAGGTYSVDVPAVLAEGNFTVVASATDAAGNAASANDAGTLDITAPSLTVDAPALTNDSTPTITGTTNLPVGSTVTLTITDSAGALQTITATVASGGTYSVDVPAALAEGNFTVVASAADAAGNPASANDAGTIDLTAPAVTLTLAPVTADNVLSAGEAGGSVLISGTAGGDVRVGDTVTLTINGGTYTATVGAGGAFSVGVPGAALAADADHRIDASVTTTDAAGNSATATTSQTYAVNTPPAGTDNTLSTAEDTAYTFSAADFGHSDADGNPLAAVRIDTLPAAGELRLAGVLVGAGQVIAASDLANLRFLPAPNANGTGYASFTFSVGDGIDFDPTPNRIGFDVTPVNDPATIGGQASGTAVEDAPGNVTGTLTVTDVDAGEAAFLAQADVAGAHGRFSIDSAGQWSYALDNADPAVQALGAGQTLPSETFTVATLDGTSRQVTIAIVGSNDGPQAVADSGTLLENATLTATAAGGVLANDTDVDAGDSKAVSAVTFGATNGTVGSALAGTYGTLTLNADGSYSYSANRPAADALVANQVVTEQFSYTVRDAAGATSTATLSFTITGTNDLPTITGPLAGAVKEDTTLSATGTLSISDADAGQSAFLAQNSVAGTYGTFSINAAGVWTYTLNNAAANVQALGGSTTVSESFGIASADGTARTVVVSIAGTNDAPSVVAESITVNEDQVASGNVLANDADVDTGSTLAVTQFVVGGTTYAAGATALLAGVGTLSIAANGAYTFTPATDYAGAVPVATYTVSDGTATADTTLSINLTALNDTPVNTVPGAVAVLEDVRTAIAGVSVSDPDEAGSIAGQKLASVQISVSNGTLLVSLDSGTTVSAGANGGATMTLTGTQASLNATLASLGYQGNANYVGGDTLVVISRDGQGLTDSDTVAITVNPVNDAPSGTDRTVTIAEDGSYTLSRGDFGFSDAAGEGNNFASVRVSPPSAGTLTLNGVAINAATSVTVAQLDAGQLRFAPAANANGTGYASLSFAVRDDGGTANGGIDTDPTPNTITFNVTPVNDAPQAFADSGALDENTTLTATAAAGVLANDTDVDAGDSKTVSAIAFGATTGSVGSALAGTYGTLTLNADGSYSYSANRPAADALVAGQIVTEQFSYTMRDAAGLSATATLSFTITGTNDAPTITGPLTGSVREDVTLSSTGTLTISDADTGQSSFIAQSGVAGTYGSFAISAAGVWTYTLNNAAANVQALGAGASLTESFDVFSADNTRRTVVVTVLGSNDAPAAVADLATAVEAGGVGNATAGTNPSGNVLGNDTDVDTGDTRSVSAVSGTAAGTVGGATAGAYGTLTLNADGSYSYTLNNSLSAVQALRGVANTLTDSFNYTVRDASGAISTTTLTVTIQGSNDNPVAVADSGALNENATLTTTAVTGVLANDTDVDSGDSKAVSAVTFGASTGTVGSALAGTYGTLTLNADGSYSYSANRPAADALVANQVVTEQFGYTVRDAAGATSTATLSFTVTGTNDVPTITGPLAGAVKEDTTLSATGTLTISDADAGQSAFLAQSSVAGTYGTFSINAAGVWTYTLNNAAANVQALGGSTTVSESFGIASADGTARTVVVSIAGTNDAPSAVADLRTTNEDSAVSGNVLSNDSDVDTGSTLALTQFVVNGTTYAAGATASLAGIGTLSIAANGAYTFTPAANYAGAVPVATYTVSDGSASSSSTLALSITPAADAPTLVINGTSITGGTTVTPAVPPSVGLQMQFYDNVAAVGTGNAGNIGTVESGVESTTATSTSTVTDVAVANIAVDDAYRFTGYIHLQAGQTYTIGGYRDDTLMVKIGGTSVYAVGYNNWGTLTGTSFTPVVSGYYSLEVIAYNGDGVGSLDLTMAVGAGAAVDLSTANFRLYPDSTAFTGSGSVVGPLVPVGDGGFFPTNAVGNEDSAISLGSLAASLNDTDGSESLALRIGAIPVGATLSDGTHSFTATAGNTSVGINGWTLAGLKLTPPANYAGALTLDVTATATDSNGSTAVSQGSLPVIVQAVADLPSLAGQSTLIAVAQSNAIAATLNLPVLSTLNDTDGSEILSVAIAGVPSGATLNHGSSNGAGTWTVSSADLADLTLTLPTGYTTSGTTLTVTAISTESSNGSVSSTSSSLTLIADYAGSTTTGTAAANTITSNNNNNYIDALGGDDTIDARGGNDLVRAGDGNDSIVGGSGNDMLYGQAGNDTIVGGTGNDYISGGAGNDTLTGSATAGTADLTTDVFAWTLADAGTAGAPATDTITDFSAAAVSAGGDVLDLRDLLSGDVTGPGNSAGNLANFLDFTVSGSGAGATTTIHISSTGQFAGGVYSAAQEDQAIVLQGIDLPSALGLGTGATDAQIIQELLTRGKLIVDSAP